MFQIHQMSIKDIATKRNLAESTVSGHLASAFMMGQQLDLSRFGLTKDTYQLIVDDITKHSSSTVSDTKARLPNSVTYGHIKVATVMYNSSRHINTLTNKVPQVATPTVTVQPADTIITVKPTQPKSDKPNMIDRLINCDFDLEFESEDEAESHPVASAT